MAKRKEIFRQSNINSIGACTIINSKFEWYFKYKCIFLSFDDEKHRAKKQKQIEKGPNSVAWSATQTVIFVENYSLHKCDVLWSALMDEIV